MMTIDEKRFRERIDETYPFDKMSQERTWNSRHSEGSYPQPSGRGDEASKRNIPNHRRGERGNLPQILQVPGYMG